MAYKTRNSTKNSNYIPDIFLISSSDSECDAEKKNKSPRCRRPRQTKSSKVRENENKTIEMIRKVTNKSEDLDEAIIISPPSTPRKQKLKNGNDNRAELQVTPPKQKKTVPKDNVLSPSSLFNQLNLNSPPSHANFEIKVKIDDDKNGKACLKALFGTTYQSARKALHSAVPTLMPGREKEHQELNDFFEEHLQKKTSGTLYISGPPGTGKTASLTMLLEKLEVSSQCQQVYINCTSIKSSTSVFSNIAKELKLKPTGRSEKDYLRAIEKHIVKTKKMILLVLDELDQLESKKQSVLYTIFEWPAIENSKMLLVGIANALDLTDRVLPRLQSHCKLKPQLMHFAPYTKQQIVHIFTERLKMAGVLDVFSPVALQMLAGKVAAVSGDVRRALDIGRRVVEIVEQNRKNEMIDPANNLENIENTNPSAVEQEDKPKAVDLNQVVSVLNNVYGTSQRLDDDYADDSFPLQQKVVLCTLLLMLKVAKNKDITLGKLHDSYKKVCSKRHLVAVDQAEFVGLCSLIETRGIIRISGRKEPRLHKVNLQWNQEEVEAVLKDKKLVCTILEDDKCLGTI